MSGNAETGAEVCTVAALCQTGQDGTHPAVAPGGRSTLPRIAAAAVRKKRAAKPGIKPMHLTVKHPGAVPFRFYLNKPVKQLLARRHKIKLRGMISLKLPRQPAITRTHVVTFTHPAKPPRARKRGQAARRLCLRKHPHQARLCNRL